MWRTRRQSLRLLAGAIGAGLLHACNQGADTSDSSNSANSSNPGSGTPQTSQASLGIVVWTGNAPLYIAQEKGFFREAGLNLDIKTFSTNPDSAAAFVVGRIDAWTAVTSETVTLASRGKDFRVILVQDNSIGADGILARNSIGSLEDLKGKQVLVEEGAVSHFFLLQALQQVGLSDRDIKILNVSPDGAAAAYQVGKAEIAVTYSPFLEQANAAQKDGRIIFDSAQVPTAITDLYLFDTQLIRDRPAIPQAFVRGIFQGLEFLQKNPQTALPIAAKQLQIPIEELSRSLQKLRLPDRNLNLEMLGNPQSDLYLVKSLEAMATFLVQQKKISQVPDLAKLLEPKFVQSA